MAVNDNDDVEMPEGGTHWTTLLFHRPTLSFHHYDSLAGRQHNRKAAQNFADRFLAAFAPHRESKAVVTAVSLPQQTNSFDSLQESLRALRHKSDYINSMCAGAVVGAAMAGFYQGPRYRLIGALTWGAVSGGSHYLDDTFHPMHSIEDYLIDDGLLDPRVRERRQQREMNANQFYRLAKHLGKSYHASIEHDVSIIYFQEMDALKAQLLQEAAQRKAALPGPPHLNQHPVQDSRSGADSNSNTHVSSSSSSSSSGKYTATPSDQDRGYSSAGLVSSEGLSRPLQASASGAGDGSDGSGGGDSEDEDEADYQAWLSGGSKGSLIQMLQEQGQWASSSGRESAAVGDAGREEMAVQGGGEGRGAGGAGESSSDGSGGGGGSIDNSSSGVVGSSEVGGGEKRAAAQRSWRHRHHSDAHGNNVDAFSAAVSRRVRRRQCWQPDEG
ncbi:MAG: hypothetical protein WDW38_004071 [Sanguina aurantia]